MATIGLVLAAVSQRREARASYDAADTGEQLA
jgi:hypothetical protein